jgi:hypothetical protein
VADCNPGRINKRDACHLTFALLKIGARGINTLGISSTKRL